jgi:hypothetical protein
LLNRSAPDAPRTLALSATEIGLLDRLERVQKITFGEMRATGVRNVVIYCVDYRCSHCHIVPDDADRWPDELRISDIEERFVCTACGKRRADIRPDWQTAKTFAKGRTVKLYSATIWVGSARQSGWRVGVAAW